VVDPISALRQHIEQHLERLGGYRELNERRDNALREILTQAFTLQSELDRLEQNEPRQYPRQMGFALTE
jgi:hypothetical protein